jgi:hypothetical protein
MIRGSDRQRNIDPRGTTYIRPFTEKDGLFNLRLKG